VASIAAAGVAAAVSVASAGSQAVTPDIGRRHIEKASDPGLYVFRGSLVTSAVRCKVWAAILSSPAIRRVPHYGFCRRNLLFISCRSVSSTLRATAA